MKIFIDICHPAHVNFFRIVIRRLKEQGHSVKITVLNRGKLPVIAKDVFQGDDYDIIGRHRGTLWSVIFEANIFKSFTLLLKCVKFNPDIGLSAGSFVLGGVLKMLGKPNIQFDDDPERKVNVFLEKITSTCLFFPLFNNDTSGKVGKYNALKEWAYLSPRYFNPDRNALSDFGLNVRDYIFVREISVGSLNYRHQSGNIIASVAKFLPQDIKVLLSLEDKSTASQYPDNWIILQEPVQNIHSLIFFSRIVISSGDSVAREGALLGVPSIYCGTREMAANRVMTEKKMLLHCKIQDVPETLTGILNGTIHFEEQVTFRSELEKEWADVPQFIVDKISSLIR